MPAAVMARRDVPLWRLLSLPLRRSAAVECDMRPVRDHLSELIAIGRRLQSTSTTPHDPAVDPATARNTAARPARPSARREYGYTFDPADPNVDITANGSGPAAGLLGPASAMGTSSDTLWVDSPAGGAPAITAQDFVPDVWVAGAAGAPNARLRALRQRTSTRTGSRTSRTTRSSGSIRRKDSGPPVSGTDVGRRDLTVSVQAIPQRLIVDTGRRQHDHVRGRPAGVRAGDGPDHVPGVRPRLPRLVERWRPTGRRSQ